MTIPRVSVKMLVYNHAPFLAQAIESVLQQRTSFPFELVIGEDCSTDGSQEIARRYAQRHPGVIRLITSARNVGAKQNGLRTVQECRGAYLAFCEGDDYWQRPDKLQMQADYLDGHPRCGIVFSDYDCRDDATGCLVKSVNRARGFTRPMRLGIEEILGPEGGVIRTCTIMARKPLIDEVIASDPSLHQNERFPMGDTQLFAEASLVSDISYLPESLATYRLHAGSATRQKDPQRDAAFWQAACEMKLYLCDKHHLGPGIRRQVESDWCDISLRLAFHSGDAELAREAGRRKGRLTWKQRFQYLGAMVPAARYPLRVAARLRAAAAEGREERLRCVLPKPAAGSGTREGSGS